MADPLPRLVLTELGFTVAGRTIVKPVTLELSLRERTVVLGPNGAGKTTLLQLIHGMLPGAEGAVRVCEASGQHRAIRSDELGFVLQRPVMLGRSVKDNVLHALSVRNVRVDERDDRTRVALARVGLGEFAERSARRLSGGEQQRLAIARVIAASPACLLLDEPTAHLDPGATAVVERLLMSLAANGLGLVMTTHDLGQARRIADQVVFMHQGRVLECSRAQEFFDSPATEKARRFLAGELLD